MLITSPANVRLRGKADGMSYPPRWRAPDVCWSRTAAPVNMPPGKRLCSTAKFHSVQFSLTRPVWGQFAPFGHRFYPSLLTALQLLYLSNNLLPHAPVRSSHYFSGAIPGS